METFDVIIVGAGLSGIGAAVHLQRRCPGKSYAILEAREVMGGTWDLFRYPGIRSDSDMFTLGYNFKPWLGEKSIADAASIRGYIHEAAAENGVDRHIRYGHKLVSADWSTTDAHWTLTLANGTKMTARWVMMCPGYYRYDQGHMPEFRGASSFNGTIIHPQHWPEEFDYVGQQVVVIGSGATAMTLVPAMAETAAHVTMLQRSPTYVASVPSRDPLAAWLRKWLPKTVAYRAVRLKNVLVSMVQFALVRRYPAQAKERLIGLVRDALGPGHDVETHFSPRYNVWDQRVCAVPDEDLFTAMKAGRVSVVTDNIDEFVPEGVKLTSGKILAADVIVTATGLELQLLGGAALFLDGVKVNMPDTMIYKGMMIGGVPNLSYIIGYNNASWTLKADLSSAHACRIINHMDRRGFVSAVPKLDPDEDASGNFFGLTSGYLERAQSTVPKQGVRHPWKVHHNYARDYASLKLGGVDDGVLQFTGPVKASRAA